jgi:5-methylthioribose kinase
MLEITYETAADYLRQAGRVDRDEPVEVRELAGGVSNVVLLVRLPAREESFVVKQARGQLRVKEQWLCPVERIWREVEVLLTCNSLIPQWDGEKIRASVPKFLWQDRENYCYAMTAAAAGHGTWKELLLAGHLDERIANACGRLLGDLHAGSWKNANIAEQLDDRTYFDQLRLDPYYRHVARHNPSLAPAIQNVINSVWQNRCCLVHGDFSPKNLLVWPGHLMLIDFEVGHYGDPAFDLGFFLTHLVLKSIWAGERRIKYLELASAFWQTYQQRTLAVITHDELQSLERRMLHNLAGCMLARVDGKSPVDYLTSQQQEDVRTLAIEWLRIPPGNWRHAVIALSKY